MIKNLRTRVNLRRLGAVGTLLGVGVTSLTGCAMVNVVEDGNFTILDVGDHKRTDTWLLESRMKQCNKKDISLGIYVNSSAKTMDDIYNDVEFAKGIVSDYDIGMPIYLEIDKILEDDSLNPTMKSKLINCFLEKCSANGMYVGIKGTDTNLTLLKSFCDFDISSYDTYLVMDKENITYDGTYNIVENLDKKITQKNNLSEIINNGDLNNPDYFVKDISYTFTEDDNINEIAMKCGLSVDELLKFNDLNKDELEIGTVLRIPTVTKKTVIGSGNFDFPNLEEPELGIDISYYQGTDIDWEKLSSTVEYIILKVNQGDVVDKCYNVNAEKCSQYGISMGGYCYNHWDGYDADTNEDFKILQEQQADIFVNAVENEGLTFPAYLDIEFEPGIGVSDRFTKDQVKIMLDVWHTTMSENGYIPGVYCSASVYADLCRIYECDLSEKFEVWIAGGPQYISRENEDYTLDEIIVPDSGEVTYLGQTYEADTLQVTNCGSGFGVGNSEGHVDVNFNFTDYDKLKINDDAQVSSFGIKEFNRVTPESIAIPAVAIAGVTAGAATIITKALVKKRHQTRK